MNDSPKYKTLKEFLDAVKKGEFKLKKSRAMMLDNDWMGIQGIYETTPDKFILDVLDYLQIPHENI